LEELLSVSVFSPRMTDVVMNITRRVLLMTRNGRTKLATQVTTWPEDSGRLLRTITANACVIRHDKARLVS